MAMSKEARDQMDEMVLGIIRGHPRCHLSRIVEGMIDEWADGSDIKAQLERPDLSMTYLVNKTLERLSKAGRIKHSKKTGWREVK